MKKTKEIMGLFLLSAALLAGCGTAADAPETGSTTPGTGTTGNVETEFQTPGPTEETQEELQEEPQENQKPVEGVHFEIDGTTFRIYGTGSMSSNEANQELQQFVRMNQKQLAEVEHIQVEEGITDLGGLSFRNWTNIKSTSLPNSLREVSGDLFSGTNLITEKDGFEICGTVLVKAPDRAEVIVPEGITLIAEYAFSNCTSIERLVLPEGLINISSHMFDYELENPNLKVIEFPKSVEYIADWAFVDAKGAKKVFPAGCKVWQMDDTILSSEDVDWGVEPVNGLYIVNNMLVDTDAVSGEVVIPEGVTTICDYVFQGNEEITSVVLPESLKKIEDSAFSKCTGLVSVVVPAGVTSIEDSAFYGCTGLTSVQILGNIETVGENIFSGCKSLSAVTVVGLAQVSEYMFYECEALAELTLPKGVTTIGKRAFLGCKELVNIEIPEGVQYINEDAFEKCEKLEKAVLPASIISIDEDAFYRCSKLTIYGASGSYAEEYATANNIPFVAQ